MTPERNSLMNALTDSAKALDAASADLASAINDAAEAEQAYQVKIEEYLLKIYDEYKGEGRPPAEDLRRAMAHSRMKGPGEKKLYGDHLMAKARVAGIKAYMDGLKAATSARQSMLKQIQVEASLAGQDFRHESQGGPS